MKTEKSTKEIAKEIKSEIQKIKGVKLSVTCKHNHLIDISVMQAPFAVLVNEDVNHIPINHHYLDENIDLTKEGKTLFNLIDEIVKKYHWDESDPMTDYFFCAFYYHYSVGKWDRRFVNTSSVLRGQQLVTLANTKDPAAGMIRAQEEAYFDNFCRENSI